MSHASRRDFIKTTAVVGAGYFISGTPARADESSPNNKLNVAVIGCGGKGSSDTDGVAGENVVALCDVDDERAGKTYEKYPNARRYRDFRVLLEKVDGVWQGACVTLADSELLRRGLHRLAFAGDSLWIGRTHLSWAGSEGIATLRPSGKVPFDVLEMHAAPHGFRIEFTAPLAGSAADPSLWLAQSYTYAYHADYGSPQLEKTAVVPAGITLCENGRIAEVELPELRANFVYEFNLAKLTASNGEPIFNPHVAYTLRRLPPPKR